MAKIVDPKTFRTTERTSYNWNELLDGNARLLEPGVDFKCSVPAFRSYAHQQASSREMRVIIRRQDDGTIYVQAFSKNLNQ
jgi:hypothetical protein